MEVYEVGIDSMTALNGFLKSCLITHHVVSRAISLRLHARLNHTFQPGSPFAIRSHASERRSGALCCELVLGF